MNNIGTRATVCMLVLGSVGLTAYLGAASRPKTTPQTFIFGPSTWVPIVADYRNRLGDKAATGKYYRASDGSTRLDVTSPDGQHTVVTILNVAENKQYSRNPLTGSWAVLTTPVGGILQTRVRATMPGLLQGTEYRSDYLTYRRQTAGATFYLAPDLNFLQVAIEHHDGSVEEYINIATTEPDRSVFEPPDGVALREASDVRDLLRFR